MAMSSKKRKHEQSTESPKVSQPTPEQMVEGELKSLQPLFVTFATYCLADCETDHPTHALDIRLVMREVLDALLQSKGYETPDTITDTHPRDRITSCVNELRVEEYDREYFARRIEDDERIDARAADMDQLYERATRFYRSQRIPPTRAFAENHFSDMNTFLLSQFPQCAVKQD